MSKHHEHVMVDLETLGTRVDAAFISIGACSFELETGKIGATFYENVDWESSLKEGRTITASTLKWWFRQSEEAQNKVCAPGKKYKEVLKKFWAFFDKYDGDRKIWGNGSTFDVTMLQSAYERIVNRTPWAFYNVRDQRTMLDVAEVDKGDIKFTGVAHNALDDAIHQAKLVSLAYKKLRSK